MANTALNASHNLDALRSSHTLSIIRITDAIAAQSASAEDNGTNRTSDVSTSTNAYDDTSPASLRAELAHYQELFSKLRFSYIEQVTKEKFLRAITSEDPLFVEPAENAELESRLIIEKEGLAVQKEEVKKLTDMLEEKGKELAKRYEMVSLQKQHLDALPATILELQEDINKLREQHPSPVKSTNPMLNLPLDQTQALLAQKQAELAALNSQRASLQKAVDAKNKEVNRLDQELVPLQNQKRVMVKEAMDARQRKEAGGVDELEERGRWYKASAQTLKAVLEA